VRHHRLQQHRIYRHLNSILSPLHNLLLLVVADVAVVLFPAVLGFPRAEVGEDLEGDLLQGWKKPGFFKKTSPVGFFVFLCFFVFFLFFFCFFYIFAQKREF
jgi:hypothetical protein